MDSVCLQESGRGGLISLHNDYKYRKLIWQLIVKLIGVAAVVNAIASCKPINWHKFHHLGIFNQPQHNHNPERSMKEDWFLCVEDQELPNWWKDRKYDRCNSDSDRRSCNIETETISRNLNVNDRCQNGLM